jgi:hypothetical protein
MGSDERGEPVTSRSERPAKTARSPGWGTGEPRTRELGNSGTRELGGSEPGTGELANGGGEETRPHSSRFPNNLSFGQPDRGDKPPLAVGTLLRGCRNNAAPRVVLCRVVSCCLALRYVAFRGRGRAVAGPWPWPWPSARGSAEKPSTATPRQDCPAPASFPQVGPFPTGTLFRKSGTLPEWKPVPWSQDPSGMGAVSAKRRLFGNRRNGRTCSRIQRPLRSMRSHSGMRKSILNHSRLFRREKRIANAKGPSGIRESRLASGV